MQKNCSHIFSGGERAIHHQRFFHQQGGLINPISGCSRQCCLNPTALSSQVHDRRQEEEPMDWDDVPSLPEVSAPFVFPVPTEDEGPHLRSDRRQEEEPMDWDDVPSLPEVSAPFVFPVPHGR
ncbi:hypothetical protein TNCV_1255681 [Trichonephila clavipes]|nr:hypothetical protein TNCV_1255681 [Trichonephila clavipes]